MSFAATTRPIRMTTLKLLIVRAVPVLNRVRPRTEWQHSLRELRHFPTDTWGGQLASFIDARHFADFLTNYEAHDAFHTLLDYDTNVIGEMRLQGFMVGNRSASFAGRVLFALGGLVLPELWPQLRCDLLRGQRSVCVGQWHVPSLLGHNIEQLRAQIAGRVDLTPFG